MAEFLNIVDKVDKVEKNKIDYKMDFVDSPLRLSYGFSKHPKDEAKYFLTIRWNYKHRHSENGEIYFLIEVTTAYQVDPRESKTTFDNVYSIILDSHSRLRAHYKTEIENTNFDKLELTEPDEDAFNDKVKKIVYTDLPELGLQ